MAENIHYMERIGVGCFGEVHKAKWKGQIVAVKKLHDFLLDYDPSDNNKATFEAECKILQRLRHRNIVQMLDFIISPPVLITELLDCDLAHYIGRLSPTKVSFTETVSIMQDVAEGLAYLHQCNPPIVHRDLASKNVLLTKERQAKIADLGLAKVFPSRGKEYASPIPGTPVYAAPDTYPESMALTAGALRRAEYSVKIDVFSFGVMLMEVITARPPRPAPMWPFTEDGQPIPEYERRSQDINEMGEHKLAGLVLQCLQNSSSERPSAGEVAARLQQEMGKIQQKQRIGQYKKGPTLKILSLGSSGVGKTCIVERFLNPAFDCSKVLATVGYHPQCSSIILNERLFQLHIEDTAGQERYGSIAPALIRNSDGVLLVFDVTKYATLAEIPRVIQLVKENSSSQPSMVLVGNKADMPDHKVSRESAEKFAEYLGIPYVETSAISRLNIEQVFETIARQIYNELDLSDIDTYMISDGSIRNLRENNGPRKSLCNRFTNWLKSWF